MTITEYDLGWGSYKGFTGYFFRGQYAYHLPGSPTPDQKRYLVCSATESAGASAFNGYDSCGWSLGRYQITELCSGWLVTNLLGRVQEQVPGALDGLLEASRAKGYDFVQQKTRWGSWTWRDKDGPISRSESAARRFFSGNSNGRVGSWSRGDLNARHAADLIVPLVNIWDNEDARRVQDEFLLPRLKTFVMPQAKWLIDLKPSSNIIECAQAAFLSFSLNRSTTAADMLALCMKRTPYTVGTKEWLIELLKTLTFEPKIAIYPERYGSTKNKGHGIRAVLERLYSIDLPDFAEELAVWQADMPQQGTRDLSTTAAIQQALIDLGLDLGPAGADGKAGAKTQLAVMAFQRQNNLQVDGVIGPKTLAKLQEKLATL